MGSASTRNRRDASRSYFLHRLHVPGAIRAHSPACVNTTTSHPHTYVRALGHTRGLQSRQHHTHSADTHPCTCIHAYTHSHIRTTTHADIKTPWTNADTLTRKHKYRTPPQHHRHYCLYPSPPLPQPPPSTAATIVEVCKPLPPPPGTWRTAKGARVSH